MYNQDYDDHWKSEVIIKFLFLRTWDNQINFFIERKKYVGYQILIYLWWNSFIRKWFIWWVSDIFYHYIPNTCHTRKKSIILTLVNLVPILFGFEIYILDLKIYPVTSESYYHAAPKFRTGFQKLFSYYIFNFYCIIRNLRVTMRRRKRGVKMNIITDRISSPS